MEIAHTVLLNVMCFITAKRLLIRAPDAVIGFGDDLTADGKARIVITIGTQHLSLVLADRSIAYDRELRLRRAFFGHGCMLDGRYVGVLHIDNGVLGTLRLGGKNYLIRSGSSEVRHMNDLEILEKGNKHTIIVRILLINDVKRTARLGSSLIDETLNIFRSAGRIFEREDWGGYKISLKVSNIFNIEKGPVALKIYRDKHIGQKVLSDSAEEEYESSHENALGIMPGASQDASGLRRRYKKELASMADMLERILANSKSEDEFHEKHDVVFLLSDETNKDIEGISYDRCAFGRNICLGIVFTDSCNDSHFHGRVLAHELVHTLGGPHDTEDGFLMEAISNKHTKQMDVQVSRATKLAVTQFLRSRGRVSA
eukprot:jgi/Antlo1/2361/1722